MNDRFTEKSIDALQSAQRLAASRHNQQVDVEHLFLALLEQEQGLASAILKKTEAPIDGLKAKLDRELEKLPRVTGGNGETSVTSRLNRIMQAAEAEAKKLKDEYVSVEHFLLAFLDDNGATGRILKEAGLNRARLSAAIQQIRGNQRVTTQNPEATYESLEKYGRDLTELARAGKLDPVIGRDEEIRRVVQVLSRRTKNNPVLIGEPGVGKTAIVEGLACSRIIRGDVPEGLKDKKIVALDMGALIAGAEVPRRIRGAAQGGAEGGAVGGGEHHPLHRRVIHTVVGSWQGWMGRWMPATCSSRFCLAARLHLASARTLTLDEYRKYIEKDAAFERRFQPVVVGSADGRGPDLAGILRAGYGKSTRSITASAARTPLWSRRWR